MSTIRPNNSSNNQSNQTVRPNSAHTAVNSTIRPDICGSTNSPGGAQSTIRPGSSQSTVRPVTSNSNISNTDRGMVSKTTRPTSIHNVASSVNDKIDSNMYQPRSLYVIDGVTYNVVKALSLTSGEAQVFLVEDPKGNMHVLKLYYRGAAPVVSILNKVKSVNEASLFFKEESHGAFEDRYYELMNYYDGDTLENADVRKKEAVIAEYIGKMAAAIDFCHQLGFIHRDIKPSNFIFESKERKNILLGDFGIAVECDANGDCISDMARTKIYAAPEVYLNTGDGKAKFSTKSDFYSLGIVILYLWMGKDDFTHFEKENELQLATMKAYGDLPIPSNMSPRLYSLVKALIEPNPSDRAGFKEIEDWIKGGNPFGNTDNHPSSTSGQTFKIIFNGEKGLIASTPKELASIMISNQTLAISYLYKGVLSRWLNDAGRPELAVEMDKIREDIFPRNTSAGLDAACYTLNPSIPFKDINGNNCSTSSEISVSILSNFDRYLAQISNDSDCRLLVYLQTHGLNQAVSDFRKEFVNNKRLGLLYLVYRLDADQPWYMTDEEGNVASLNSCNEILDWVSKYPASEQSLSDIVSQAFLLWTSKRNTIAAAAIKPIVKHEGDINYSFGILYRLDPKVGLFFITDEKSPKYIFTVQQLGSLINRSLMNVINGADPDGVYADFLYFIYDIQKNEKNTVYHFLQSKGDAYAKYIDWIKYCLDLQSDDNTKKAGPYNDTIALFKIVKGMGGDVFYTFKSGKTIHNPSELSNVSQSDIEDAKDNKYGALEKWISVFFQEDPNLDKSSKYSYERKTSEYVNFLSTNGFKSQEIQRYQNSKQIVESRALKLQSTLSAIKKSKLIVACVSLLPLGIAALLLAILWRPDFGSLKFGNVFSPVAIILTIYFCFADRFVGKIIGEAIWGCAIGAVISGLLVWLSGFASTVTPYVASAIVAVMAVYFYNKCIGTNLKEKENDDILNPGFEHLELEPLHEAYHPQPQGFDSSIGDRSATYQKELNGIKKTMWTKAVPVGIITVVGILYFLFFYTGSSESHYDRDSAYVSQNEQFAPDFSDGLYGTWVGKMEGRRISIQFEKNTDPKKFSFIMSGLGEDEGKIVFSGEFDPLANELKVKTFRVDKNSSFGVGVKASGILTLDNDLIFGDVDLKNPKDGDVFISIPINVQYEPN